MKKSIEVLMVSTSYPASMKDWKGLFIRNLCDALAERSDLTLNLWAPPGETHSAIRRAPTAGESSWLENLMNKGGIAHLLRTAKPSALAHSAKLLLTLKAVYRRSHTVDLYHVNWLQNALPLPANRKPLVVSVLGTDMQLLKLPMMQSALRRIFRQHPTTICPNADWMVPILNKFFSDTANIAFVPFGIDPMWYSIRRDRPPAEPATWLAVTRLTQTKLGPLFEWCAPLFEGQQRRLHLFGPMQENIEIPPWVHYHGPASPEALCRDWFPTAQGLITLSRHAEGRPQVMLEAMAAGLPIIASRQPAHENIIIDNDTGVLCAHPAEVDRGIRLLEAWPENRRIGTAARAWVSREIGTWDDCAERYTAQYRKLLGMDKDA
jgi:glycosyltransferase involved in cell wall biosynthesis